MWKEYYRMHKREWTILLTILVVMVSVTAFSGNVRMIHSAEDVNLAINTTLSENLESYAGVFSVAVTSSVNPMATLAVLSVIGIVEKADVYNFEWQWLISASDFLNKVPFIRTVRELPISNPTACVLLTVIAVVLYVMRSFAASKAVSNATLDKIEEVGGYVITVALSLLPVATSQVVEAASSDASVRYVSQGTFVTTLIVGILAAIFNSIVYMCVYKCIDAVEVIAAAIPVKGMNLIVEVVKALLHVILVVLMIFSPVISVIISVIIALVAIILFRKLMLISTYYDYIYLKPLWRSIFHKHETTPFIHTKFPKRARKRYPDIEMAIPVFSLNRYEKWIRKRELLWLLPKEDGVYLLQMRLFRKQKEIPLEKLNILEQPLYLEKTMRFIRIRTEDKKVELILSKEYDDRWEKLLDKLQIQDYQVVVDRKKAEKEAAKQERSEKFHQKMDGIGQSVKGARDKVVGVFKKEPEPIPVEAEDVTQKLIESPEEPEE